MRRVIEDLIRDIPYNDSIDNFDVKITDTSEKGEGYAGEMLFADLYPKQLSGKEYHLIIKKGKDGEEMRKSLPVREQNVREIFIYDQVIPTFQKLLKDRGLEPFDNVAKCFKTLLLEKQEFIVLQNLKQLGYGLHPRKKPMDLNHLKLTLESYGRWHALSFILRESNREEFEKYLSSDNIWANALKREKVISMFKTSYNQILDLLKSYNEHELIDKFKDLTKPGVVSLFLETLTSKEPDSVMIHGDSWSSNFMFKYKLEDTQKQNPMQVKMLDFQTACMGSPMLDLSYHIYSVCSEEFLQTKFATLLQLYYNSFSGYIQKFGYDPDELFPFSSLLKHWKKYSFYGLMTATIALSITLVDSEDVMDLRSFDGGNTLDALISKLKDEDKTNRNERLLAIARHFSQSDF